MTNPRVNFSLCIHLLFALFAFFSRLTGKHRDIKPFGREWKVHTQLP